MEGTEVLRKINDLFVDDNNRPYLNIRILHTIIIDDPFDDPPNLEFPENSPEIDYKDSDRLDVDEKIELLDAKGRTEEEILEATREHEAKTKAIVLEMVTYQALNLLLIGFCSLMTFLMQTLNPLIMSCSCVS